MTSPTHSQRQEEEEKEDDLQTQNPNSKSTQEEEDDEEEVVEEENQTQKQQQQQPQSQPHQTQTQTLTLDPSQELEQPDHLNHHPQDLQQEEGPQIFDKDEEDQDQDHPEQSGGMFLSPPSLLQPITDLRVTISDHNPTTLPLTSPTNPHRRSNKRKKGARYVKKKQAIEKKLQTLTENLKPIPFLPSKTLDFPKHEKLLKRLGLWDFVNIEFDRVIRVDLIAQLIATYDPKLRCSYVNDFRIAVNRADLARAFKFPVPGKKEKGNEPGKKEKGNVLVLEGVDLDLDSEAFSEESVLFVELFVSNWLLLHGDMWMMPSEVLNWTRVIKDGHPEKVDWASLIWFMVEKELTQGEHLGDCYYASHLQYLIKSQREEVLREEPQVEMEVEVEVEVEVKEEENAAVGSLEDDVKMGDSNESKGQDSAVLDEPNIELTLGQDTVEKEEIKDDEMMDVEERKDEEEEHRNWLLDGKNSVDEHFLQRCRLEESTHLDVNVERKQEDEEGEEDEAGAEDGFDVAPNDDAGNLLQGMETIQIPFSSQGQLCDQSSVDLFASRAERHTNSGGPSLFGNADKREIGNEHDISHHSLNGSNKRLRTDVPWDHKSSDFGMCMEQAQQLMTKARMMYESKEQACQEENINKQVLLSELQRRDSVIDHLHKINCEELQKRDGEIYRLERELNMMGNLLEGYRKALKETQKSFSEYRQRYQLPEEPIYKDAGPGGLVLSTMELEKKRQKQEEEDRLNRLMMEQKIKDIEEEYIGKFEVHLNKIHMLENMLMDFENEVKLLKELSAKQKEVPQTSGCTPNE